MGNTIIILTLSGLLGFVSIALLYMQWITVKKVKQSEQTPYYYDDGTLSKFFITGDKHRDFSSVKEFCRHEIRQLHGKECGDAYA